MNGFHKQKVCIIGAGAAGLCTLRHCLDQNLEAICYEKLSELGGTWVYNEKVNFESAEAQNSLYEGLHTNLPKEIMNFPDFPYPSSIKESFISASTVLQYLQSYSQHFKLEQHIRYQHEVVRVRPLKGKWQICVKNIKTNSCIDTIFDFVFICNGHYTDPKICEFKGLEDYKGRKMHSHYYRKPQPFKDCKVLIIGAGPSGMDITNHIQKLSSQVYLSHHFDPPPNTSDMERVIQKPDIERFVENGAIFQDGSREEFTDVIFCTGYNYSFPFLTLDCGLTVDGNYISPLYKHTININYPSMALIGMVFQVLPNQVFDMQARFALKYFLKEKKLPSRSQMMEDLEKDLKERRDRGMVQSKFHQLATQQYDYYKELSGLADITSIKPALQNIMKDNCNRYIYELNTYRSFGYEIVDDDNFVKFKLN